jgi:hypothetical protein
LNYRYGPHLLKVTQPRRAVPSQRQTDDPRVAAIAAAYGGISEAWSQYRMTLARALDAGESQTEISQVLERSREQLRVDAQRGRAEAESNPT